MAVVATLAVAVAARTAKFNKGMKSAGRILSRFRGRVNAVGRRLAQFGAIAVAAAVAGMALLVRQQFQAIDATAKLADRIGITTNALVGLQHAAEITGAGTEVLNKGLMFLSKSLGEAKQGIGEAQYALDAMGLNLDDLIKMSPDQAFLKIAGAMATLETQAERNYVATKLFGRAGQQLVNTLALGKEGIEALVKENERLYGSLSRFDASKVEKANDSIQRLWLSIKGGARGMAVAIAPYVTQTAKVLTEGFIWARENIGTIVTNTIDNIKNSIINLAESGTLDEWAFRIKMAFVGIGAFGKIAYNAFMIVAKTVDYLFFKIKERTDQLGAKEQMTVAKNLAKAWGDAAAKGLAPLYAERAKLEEKMFLGPDMTARLKAVREVTDAMRNAAKHEQRFGRWNVETMEKIIERNRAIAEKGLGMAGKDLEAAELKLPDFKVNFDAIVKAYHDALDEAEKGRGTRIKDFVEKMKNFDWDAVKFPGLELGPGVEEKLESFGRTTPAALEKGTVAAYSATTQAQYRGIEKAMATTAKESKKTNDKIDKTNAVLEDIRDGQAPVMSF